MEHTPAYALVLTLHSHWPCLPYQNRAMPSPQWNTHTAIVVSKTLDSSLGLKTRPIASTSTEYFRVESAMWRLHVLHKHQPQKRSMYTQTFKRSAQREMWKIG